MTYNYTYETKNLVNGKTYVGVHSTDDLNDGYLGSGKLLKKAIKKYGRDNFSNVILCFFDDVKQAYEEESFLVDQTYVKSNNTYNLTIGGEGGGGGGMSGKRHSKKTLAKMEGMNKGTKNGQFKGYWKTPLGTFSSSRDAAKACGISKSTLIARCHGRRNQYYKGVKRIDFIDYPEYMFIQKINCGS